MTDNGKPTNKLHFDKAELIHQLIEKDTCLHLIAQANHGGWDAEYEADKHQIRYQYGNHQILLRLPIQISYPIHVKDQENKLFHHVIVLIESGLSAVGYFENGEIIDHKVFRAYMVRKKQGKSQIKHLKTKGKSRAGSRVRLSETLEFFDNINDRLKYYFNMYRVDLIVISCSKTLIPYFYGAKNPPPFDKSDPRIYNLPMHIPQCTYENLMSAQQFLDKGELKFKAEDRGLIGGLLESQDTSFEAEGDDW